MVFWAKTEEFKGNYSNVVVSRTKEALEADYTFGFRTSTTKVGLHETFFKLLFGKKVFETIKRMKGKPVRLEIIVKIAD